MSKKEIVMSSILMSLLLIGCQKNDPVSVDNVAKHEAVADESEVIEENVMNDFVEPTAKVEFVQELEGSEIVSLSKNRIFVVNDDKSVIYDENLNIIKEVGNIVPYINVEQSYNGMFIYKEPYFHDGRMQNKYGVMDFNGEILYQAQLIGDNFLDEEYESNDADGLFDTIEIMGGYSSDIEDREKTTTFEENGKWGIKDSNGNVILNPEYGQIVFWNHNYGDGMDYYKVITESGRVGIFNNKGWVIEPTFSYEDNIFIEGNYTVVNKKTEDEKSYVYDQTGSIIKELDFAVDSVNLVGDINDYNSKSDVVYLTSKTDKDYLFDSNFNEIILSEEIKNKQISYYRTFGESLIILVGSNGNPYIIDKKGNLIFDLEEDDDNITWLGDQYIIDGMTVYKVITE